MNRPSEDGRDEDRRDETISFNPLRDGTSGGATDAAAGPHSEKTTTFGPGEPAARDALDGSLRLDPTRYSVESQIGEGGMGTIYRVVDRTLGRTVAMKVCKQKPRSDSGPGDTPTAHSRFLEEAHVTAKLNHPGIVPVHELGVAGDDQSYFTMALVKGKTLSDVFRLVAGQEGGWNLSRAVSVLIKVCQAVAYAHSKGIIHRDLKPANVMIGEFGEVYVLDWGLAKHLGETDTRDLRLVENARAPSVRPADGEMETDSPLVTQDGTVLGTPIYMSPEQAEGKIEEIDEVSDVYALGAMLYELLTQQLPYLPPGTRVPPWVLLERLIEGPPPAVLKLMPTAPRELAAICEKAMARDRSRRYSSAFELAEDLQAYLDHRVVGAYRTGKVAELRLWCYRHRRTLAAAAAVGIVSAIALVAYNRTAKTRQAETLIAAGERQIGEYGELKSEFSRLRAKWVAARRNHSKRAPVWERTGDELLHYRRMESTRQNMDAQFNGAEVDLANAARIAPGSGPRARARALLEDLYLERHRDVMAGETVLVSPLYYETRLADIDPKKYPEELEKASLIRLRSDPPDADVYCFRYEVNVEERLLPMPYDPDSGLILGETFLRIAQILPGAQRQEIFEVGDILMHVGERAVSTRGELAEAIEGLGHDDRVSVTVERHGRPLELEWAPFAANPNIRAGKLEAIHLQLGLIFEGYPLDFVDGARVGRTSSDGTLDVELPRGSYLLVFRRSGCRDTRFPVVVPWREQVETVRLVKSGAFPVGAGEFVHVPAGPFTYGGDAMAFQSLDRGEADLGDFLIGRYEVTVAEYLEFLNAPEVGVRDGGFVEREKDAYRDLLNGAGFEPGDEESPEEQASRSSRNGAPAEPGGEVSAAENGLKVYVVPHEKDHSFFFYEKVDGAWVVKESYQSKMTPNSPVTAVPLLAAVEYARWRSSRDPRWSYRLPTDLEWEKAARGVDRRTHVWGEYLVYSFCWSYYWWTSAAFPWSVGRFACDESVYGVRDLAGSMAELTSTRIYEDDPYFSRRGGNWKVSDDENLRVATRNGIAALGRSTEIGIRLVAEPARKEW